MFSFMNFIGKFMLSSINFFSLPKSPSHNQKLRCCQPRTQALPSPERKEPGYEVEVLPPLDCVKPGFVMTFLHKTVFFKSFLLIFVQKAKTAKRF